jgi:Carboxypeptidase regulatory-like domain
VLFCPFRYRTAAHLQLMAAAAAQLDVSPTTMRFSRAYSLLLCGLATPALQAQGIVGGTVMGVDPRAPIACLTVSLVNARDSAVAQTRTRDDGTFEFAAPPPGLYRYGFYAQGFAVIESDTMTLAPDSDRDEILQLRLSLPRGTFGFVPPWARDHSLAAQRRGSTRQIAYPAPLQEQGVEGRVVLGIVVDSSGGVDPARTFLLESSHPLFLTAVRAAIRGSIYDPAEVKDHRVCSLIADTFEFRLRR